MSVMNAFRICFALPDFLAKLLKVPNVFCYKKNKLVEISFSLEISKPLLKKLKNN